MTRQIDRLAIDPVTGVFGDLAVVPMVQLLNADSPLFRSSGRRFFGARDITGVGAGSRVTLVLFPPTTLVVVVDQIIITLGTAQYWEVYMDDTPSGAAEATYIPEIGTTSSSNELQTFAGTGAGGGRTVYQGIAVLNQPVIIPTELTLRTTLNFPSAYPAVTVSTPGALVNMRVCFSGRIWRPEE